jgi:hypothetical protein
VVAAVRVSFIVVVVCTLCCSCFWLLTFGHLTMLCSLTTGLLRVGFGEAGANIISANLSAKDSSTAINPLLPGVRIYAIFGFCDIHHFEDINRKLSNDVLKFVNCIAEIVHSR